MTGEINPLAPHALPAFITSPAESDVLLIGIAAFLVLAVFLIGILFFWLHSLPERMAHKSQKLQLEIVAVLCLLSLFTHNNALWAAALLLAVVDLPDIGTPLNRIGAALDRLTGASRDGSPEAKAETPIVEPAVSMSRPATAPVAAAISTAGPAAEPPASKSND